MDPLSRFICFTIVCFLMLMMLWGISKYIDDGYIRKGNAKHTHTKKGLRSDWTEAMQECQSTPKVRGEPHGLSCYVAVALKLIFDLAGVAVILFWLFVFMY